MNLIEAMLWIHRPLITGHPSARNSSEESDSGRAENERGRHHCADLLRESPCPLHLRSRTAARGTRGRPPLIIANCMIAVWRRTLPDTQNKTFWDFSNCAFLCRSELHSSQCRDGSPVARIRAGGNLGNLSGTPFIAYAPTVYGQSSRNVVVLHAPRCTIMPG
jgi:hypothetical protein